MSGRMKGRATFLVPISARLVSRDASDFAIMSVNLDDTAVPFSILDTDLYKVCSTF